jgi:hypothetical protein
MMRSHKHCQEVRSRLEARRDAGMPPDQGTQRHLADCAACAGFAELQAWSRQVLIAGEVAATPPLMSAVWASIHRASEQAWDSALTRSFRYLLPYMVAVVALVLLAGGLLANHGTPTPVQAASTAFSVLNQPSSTAAGVISVANLPARDPADILGVAHP